MTHTETLYWLKGYIDITHGTPPSPAQWAVIKERLEQTLNMPTPERFALTKPSEPAAPQVNLAAIEIPTIYATGFSHCAPCPISGVYNAHRSNPAYYRGFVQSG